jgi:Fe2+ or Zn2+ uptake regulation protein
MIQCTHDDECLCQECCHHEEMDHFICVDCGRDMTEYHMAIAYDRAKDLRKYGGEA